MEGSDREITQHHLLGHVVAFVHLLRIMGVEVSTGQTLDLVRALDHVSIISRSDFQHAARATLICKREDLPQFEAAFAFFWRTPSFDPMMMALPVVKMPPRNLRLPTPKKGSDGDGGDREEQEERLSLTMTYSQGETLRSKDFGAFTWEEVQACKELMKKLTLRVAPRRTRRTKPTPRGHRIDMRRMLRHNMRYGGEPIILPRKEVRTRQRPLVVLCDISGSMDRYSRILLQFVHVISNGLHDVEAFVFGTRLTRITRLLRERDIDEAVAMVSKQVVDWSGGTRIGETMKQFNYQWGRRVLGRGPVVLLISDGWDRGDPKLLGREMERLQRSCHRLIWLNPLLGSANYQPLTQGMQAALPHVDDFLPVHNLLSLEQLGEKLASVGVSRPERKQRV
ncbi:MAG: VWA domain-containing protein [Roseiflexaceae bacterium]